MKEQETSGFNRRSFLKTLGIVSGAAAVAPLTSGTAGAMTSSLAKSVFGGSAFKVGLVIQSGSWTTDSILQGISLYLKEIEARIGSRNVELITESFGAGSIESITRKLVEQDKVDIVIAQANTRMAASLRGYIESNRVPFIELNAGEVITADSAVTPHYFRSTLNLWQAHAAMGAWAAEHVGKRAGVLTSFSNSGFDFHTAFALGFQTAGGTADLPRVTGSPNGVEHPVSALSSLRNESVDVIYGSYADQAAQAFASAYQSTGMHAPLFGTDMREGRSRNVGRGTAIAGSRFAGSWSPSLGHEENQQFLKAYRSFSGREADEYAVLGYDTIRVVLDAAQRASGITSLSEALLSVGSVGPRGPVRFDKHSQSLLSQVYLCDSVTGAAITELEYAVSTRATNELKAHTTGGVPRSGWLNSYLAG